MNFEDQVHANDESIKKFQDLAGIGYSPIEIAKYYSWNVKEFTQYFYGSEKLLELYDSGILQSKAKIALAAIESAQTGNVTQAQRLDKIQRDIEFSTLKNIIVYGKEG